MPRTCLTKAIEWLYPSTCLLCGAPGDQGRDLCRGCWTDLPWIESACARCGLPFSAAPPAGAVCGRCQSRAPPFDRCIAALRYEGLAPTLVGGAKFRGQLNAARLLGQCLAAHLSAQAVEPPDVLIPVPLHQVRLRERGYNQAEEIGRSLGCELGLTLDPACCARLLATPPQAGLDERQRRRNIRGAFSATRDLSGCRVAILDDVVTTASTVGELSRVLRGAGAVAVDVWAVARTP